MLNLNRRGTRSAAWIDKSYSSRRAVRTEVLTQNHMAFRLSYYCKGGFLIYYVPISFVLVVYATSSKSAGLSLSLIKSCRFNAPIVLDYLTFAFVSCLQ